MVTSELTYIKLSEVSLLPYNPRKIKKADFDRLIDSIKINGFWKHRPLAIEVQDGKNFVLCGNQRVKAAKKLKLKEVPAVFYSELTDDERVDLITRELFLVIFAVLFSTADISSGYIKNIGGQVQSRGALVISRAIALAVFTIMTLAGVFVFQAVANGIIFGYLEWGDARAILLYFATEVVLHYALVLICMTIAVTLKNNVISMVIAVCLTMNVMTIVYGLVNNAIQKMGIQNFQIYEYTITGKLSLLPMNPGGKECLAAFGVALAFIVATIVAGSVVFQKRDI